MILGESHGTRHQSVDSALGQVRYWTVDGGTSVFCASGTMTLEHASAMMAYADSVIARNGARTASTFHDWTKLAGYHSEARMALTAWLLKRRKFFSAVHLASRSRLVRMGVAVANVTLDGTIEHHDDIRSLQAAFDRIHEGPVTRSIRPSPV